MLSRRVTRILKFSSRLFSTANRAVVYTQTGNPTDVLSVLSYPPLPGPGRNTVNVRFLLAPINPADINVIEGVYPSKPTPNSDLNASGKGSKEQPVLIGGNEGLAEVTDVGEGVTTLKKKDWVIMGGPQFGTWSTCRNLDAADLIKIPNSEGLSEVHGATMTVNPPTAYNVLHDFVSLDKGDWVVQNGGNSAVGQAVIQIAAAKGLRTINFIRHRDNLDELVKQLESLGATKVFTYNDLEDKSFRKTVKELTGGKDIRLGLNCVGGKETSLMAGLLGNESHLVSYGAMSKQPLSLPTSLFIFKNLTSHGFWQTRWSANHMRSEKENLMEKVAELMRQGKLREPEHEIVTVKPDESDEDAGQKIRDTFTRIAQGKHGKKVLLRLEGAL